MSKEIKVSSAERHSRIKVGIIGGTGFNNPDLIVDREELDVNTPFGKPSGPLLAGKICNVNCVILARHGPNHHLMPTNVNYRANIWALKEAGCTHVLASSATGSLRQEIAPGDLVLPDGVIDRTCKRETTFYDCKNGSPKGICHMTMEPLFCERTRSIVLAAAEQLDIKIQNGGTVVVIEGPRFSSRAESCLYRQWNCDLVGMTLMPEAVLAKEAGLCYVSIAMATDYDCWHQSDQNVDSTFVCQMFRQNIEKLKRIVFKSIELIAAYDDWQSVFCVVQVILLDMRSDNLNSGLIILNLKKEEVFRQE